MFDDTSDISGGGSMRNEVKVLVTLGLLACTGRAPTENSYWGTAPPTLTVTATTRVLPVAGGAPDLEISALLRNSTVSHIQVAVGAQCPLFVRIFPDPTGENSGSLDLSMACAQGGPTLDLAPGDTAVLTRVLRADSLASFAQGTYGINVAITTTTDLMGVWAGAVHLPL
jgi:hypothetical protein